MKRMIQIAWGWLVSIINSIAQIMAQRPFYHPTSFCSLSQTRLLDVGTDADPFIAWADVLSDTGYSAGSWTWRDPLYVAPDDVSVTIAWNAGSSQWDVTINYIAGGGSDTWSASLPASAITCDPKTGQLAFPAGHIVVDTQRVEVGALISPSACGAGELQGDVSVASDEPDPCSPHSPLEFIEHTIVGDVSTWKWTQDPLLIGGGETEFYLNFVSSTGKWDAKLTRTRSSLGEIVCDIEWTATDVAGISCQLSTKNLVFGKPIIVKAVGAEDATITNSGP